MSEELYEAMRKRTGSANRRVDPDTMEEFFTGCAPEKLPAYDPVNHPAHYKRFGVEVIDIIKHVLGPQGFKAYCIGNELKYRLRAGDKGDAAQDIAKAMKYREFREAEFES